VLWAQRSNAEDETKNLVFLTVRIIDPEDVKIDLTSTHLVFDAKSGGQDYHLNLEFYKEIDTENSQYHTTGSHVFFLLRKKEKEQEYWPRLIKEKSKLHYIRTDFDKWCDEDEQEEDNA
ncbi:hypothetical protein PACTADRAFT_30721, partial [Pachysolen tannophilus NRRL Y-2460]